MSKTMAISKAHKYFDRYYNRPSKLFESMVKNCDTFESLYSASLKSDVTIYHLKDDSYIIVIDNDNGLKITYMD